MRFKNQLRRSAKARLSLIAISLLAFGLRLYHLDANEIRSNEALGYFVSLNSLPEIVQKTIQMQEPYPIASYFVMHVWLKIAGDSLFALRFLSVCFSVLAVALIFRLARCLNLKQTTAQSAAFLLAINPYALTHSQDARMYSMSLALTIASVWLAIEWLQRQRTRYAICYIFCATLALYTHYYAAYVLLMLYVFVLIRALIFPGLQNSVINLLAPLFFIALLYAPWYEQAVTILSNYHGKGDSPTLVSAIVRTLSAFGVGIVQAVAHPLLWSGVIALSLLLAILLQLLTRRTYKRSLWLLILYLIVPFLVIWYDAQHREIFGESSLIVMLPPLLLLIASGQEFWGKSKISSEYLKSALIRPLSVVHAATMLIITVAMVVSLNQYYHDPLQNQGQGWQELAAQIRHIQKKLSLHKVIFIQPQNSPELQYYVGKEVQILSLSMEIPQWNGVKFIEDLEHQHVQYLVLLAPISATEQENTWAQMTFGEHFLPVSEQTVRDWTITIYRQSSESEEK